MARRLDDQQLAAWVRLVAVVELLPGVELTGVAVVVATRWWRRNAVLGIVTGTATCPILTGCWSNRPDKPLSGLPGCQAGQVSQARAAATMAAVPVSRVGWMTGAKIGEWLTGMSSATRPASAAR